MNNTTALISSPIGVLAVLASVAGFFFYLQVTTKAKLFDFVPPLLFIYATPVFMSNVTVADSTLIPSSSPIYSGLSQFVLPAFIVLMLIKVNIPAVTKVMGKGIYVMLMGTAGVVVGCIVAYAIVHPWLSPDAWRGYGALAGSWIGGTANLLATSEMLETPPEQVGLAVVADNVIYLVWLPILLTSRDFADRFNRWARVPEDRIAAMDAAAELHIEEDHPPTMPQYLFLFAVVFGVTWIGWAVSPGLSALLSKVDVLAPIFSESTVRILLITTMALFLSATPASKLPNTTALGTALVYIFVAGMGARASIEGLAQAPMFVLGAFIWIAIHGLFLLAGAYLFRVDVHSVAIASAANIGAAASAPIVAAHHRPNLVPVSILMALLGYALGNYLAPAAGRAAGWVAGML